VPPPDKPFLRVLTGEVLPVPPVWLMRQAGRHLPEYRAVRAKADGFLDLCFTPEYAVEVTLQPIRRYGFDAAILFSDILVVPHALGQKVWFEEGVGPKLNPLAGPEDLRRLSKNALHERLEPVYEAVRGIKAALPTETALIGFAGAPWTVASYMIEGGSSRDFAAGKLWAYDDPDSFSVLIDLLVDSTVDYLSAQVEAGVEALQIFDSWAGVWPEAELKRWCLNPLRRIAEGVRRNHPMIPIIGFPRGAGAGYREFATSSGVQALSLDTTVPLAWARDNLQSKLPVQGNLDPMVLVAGGAALERGVESILAAFRDGPHIFNLGHGILQQTPPDHVEQLLKLVRG